MTTPEQARALAESLEEWHHVELASVVCDRQRRDAAAALREMAEQVESASPRVACGCMTPEQSGTLSGYRCEYHRTAYMEQCDEIARLRAALEVKERA